MDNTDKTGKTAATQNAASGSKKGETSSGTDKLQQKGGESAQVAGAASSNPASLWGSNTGSDSKKEEKPSETTKDGPLYKFFVDALKDMYYAEKHILEALPKMKAAATTEELQEAFEDHHLMTQKQVSRLEKVFRNIGEKAEAKKCEAIIGIVKEGEAVIKETEEGSMTRDAALIIAAQKVEHYEIASYGGLVALAETMDLHTAADLLQVTLDEEEETDRDLTEIAETHINFEAAHDDDDDNEDYEDDDDYDYDDEDDDDNNRY